MIFSLWMEMKNDAVEKFQKYYGTTFAKNNHITRGCD